MQVMLHVVVKGQVLKYWFGFVTRMYYSGLHESVLTDKL